MKEKNIKVIFDTNVWVSFLIGKSLSNLKQYIVEGNITIVMSEQLFNELSQVTGREKMKKYFPKKSVNELIDLLEIIAEIVVIKPTHKLCRDVKDNFLFDLIDYSKADYLVTGDKDILEHNPFLTASIISPTEFEKEMEIKFK